MALKDLGYVEGENLVIERRFLAGRVDAADDAMRDVVRLTPDVIVAWTVLMAAAAKRATSTIPIVFVGVRAPVERGLVSSLAHPNGNITGISTYPVETIDPKLLELAKQLMPQASRIAVLRSSADPPGTVVRQETAARTLGVTVLPIQFSDDKDLTTAPAEIERSNAQLLVAPDSPLLFLRRKKIVAFAATRRLPVIYAFREAVDDGGLISLGNDFLESARRAATYVDKILRGVQPVSLPIEQPTKLQMVINARTAKALGLTIPPSLLLRADQVIE